MSNRAHSEGSSSSSDTSSDDEDSNKVPMIAKLQIKPQFIPKSERVRLAESMQTEREYQEKQLRGVEELDRRRQTNTHTELRAVLEEEKAQEEERQKAVARGTASAVDLPEATEPDLPSDEIVEAEAAIEFEKWQRRELARLKRDWLRDHKDEIAAAEKESRRRLISSELVAENALLRQQRLETAGVKKGKMNFMQKYYHKGAFFQNVVETGAEEAFKKDFNAALPEEQVDITLLPKSMQVRRGDFGKRSRSKYTHLKDQDTTDRSAGWHRSR